MTAGSTSSATPGAPGVSARVITVSAPGKMMIAGEYAVLEGAEAVVAAVDRRALVTLSPDATRADDALPPEMSATRHVAEQRVGAVAGALTLDVRALQQAGKKLGLGSSAAAAAATAGVVLRARGCDLQDPATRALALELALEGHRAVAPQGSGADVAASVLGGFVRFRRLGDGVETHALPWPEALQTVVVWTGQPARTSDMVAKVQALASAAPREHRRCMAALAAEAERFVDGVLDADLQQIIESFHAFGTAMGALGDAAGVGIVDPTAATVRELAQACGGAAKPSGAGGGDVALALFSSVEQAAQFRARCLAAQYQILSIELGDPGERDEEQS